MMENQNGWRDNNDEPLAVWSSWYGEKEAVEHVDWTCLERRTIYYLIAPDPHLAADEARHLALGTAHAVREKLEGLKKTRLFFVELPHRRLDDAGTEGILAEACFWPLEQFSAIYRDHMALREASTPVKGFSPRSMAQITAAGVEARDFLLEPLLAERSTTLIYAKTNLGKTWLALCMATAIAHRASLFGRWRAKKARKVLYIDSEMDEQSMNERVRIVAKMLYDGKRLSPRYARNFLAISRSRAERGIELFKKHVVEYVKEKEVALVVLDNLTAFTQHNDSAKAWEETHAWIDVLKKAGCAVVIIHHENKQGGQRGTSATTNAVDNVLHLVDPNDRKEKEKKGGSEPIELDRDGLLMKVTVEKGREIFGEARKAFIVNIVPNAFPPTCSAEGLPRDDKDYEPETDSSSPAPAMSAKRPYRPKNSDERGELIDKVTEKLKAGSSVAEAARDLGISVSWIYRTEELTSRLELRDARKRRAVSRARRDERILRLHREGKLVREIQGRAGASETTVRRVIDDYWITEMRESLPGFEEHGLEWTASRVASQLEGIEESHVQRLLERLRLEKAAKEVGSGKSADQIADELELPLEQVQALSEREEAKIQAKEDRRRAREQELSKIRALHTNGEKRDTIISQVGLPRHTIVTEYNRLTKQKSKQQQQADGPVVSTETTMDDERPRDPGSHDDAAG
jgi:transposase